MNWQTTNGHNLSLELEGGCRISYLPCVNDAYGDLLDFWRFVCSEQSNEETAFITSKNKFYILNGDWRMPFVEAWKNGGEAACIELWRNNEEHQSKWSNNDTKL